MAQNAPISALLPREYWVVAFHSGLTGLNEIILLPADGEQCVAGPRAQSEAGHGVSAAGRSNSDPGAQIGSQLASVATQLETTREHLRLTTWRLDLKMHDGDRALILRLVFEPTARNSASELAEPAASPR